MPDEFEQMTEPLKKEGMTVEQTTLTVVQHQATVVATYYITLVAAGISDRHALDLTTHWMDLIEEVPDEDDE